MTMRELMGWVGLFLFIALTCGMCGGFHVGSHEASMSCEKGLVIR